MSQKSEDSIRPFCVHCTDVGLDCNCVIFGDNEEKVMDNAIAHMFEYHAINPEEMTSEMKSKIRENSLYYHESVRTQILYNRKKYVDVSSFSK